MKKSIFLVLTLAIPVSIFLFLKFFGSNSFEVPVLFQTGIPGCPESEGQHIVPKIKFSDQSDAMPQPRTDDDFIVYGVFEKKILTGDHKKLIELVRIQDAFYEIGAPFFVIFFTGKEDKKTELQELCLELGLEAENFQIAVPPRAELLDFLRCGIALTDGKNSSFENLVLVDPNRNIRGIYKSIELEQTDLLILELKILKETM